MPPTEVKILFEEAKFYCVQLGLDLQANVYLVVNRRFDATIEEVIEELNLQSCRELAILKYALEKAFQRQCARAYLQKLPLHTDEILITRIIKSRSPETKNFN